MFLSRLSAVLRLSAVRQTLILLLVFGVITSLAWLGTYVAVTRDMTRFVDQRLETQIEMAVAALDSGAELPEPLFGQSLALVTNDGRRIGTVPTSFIRTSKGVGFSRINPENSHEPDFSALTRQTVHGLIIATEVTERQEELAEILAGGLWFTLFTSLAAALTAGLLIARRNQARLDMINAGLAQVARGHMDKPIELGGRRDDLSLLADRINTTTSRLDTVMGQMRVQSSNIAHDLRTPLARLRALLEDSHTGLTKHGRAVEIQTLEAALDQIDKIVGTFNALLRIAQIDSGASRDSFKPVNLGALAEQVVETFGPVIEYRGQTLILSLTQPATIDGDHDLLIQLIGNLIQNALRYGSDGQTITLTVNGSHLSLTDQGPGIAFEDREKVFQPLYQLKKERQGEGFGLGLSMVRAISELHEARLTLADGIGGKGLTVNLRFADPATGSI